MIIMSWIREPMSDQASSMDSWEACALELETPKQAMPDDIVGARPDSIPEVIFNNRQKSPSQPPSRSRK